VWKMMPDSMNGTVECYPSEGDHVIQENRWLNYFISDIW
jgi:hypothetical protein